MRPNQGNYRKRRELLVAGTLCILCGLCGEPRTTWVHVVRVGQALPDIEGRRQASPDSETNASGRAWTDGYLIELKTVGLVLASTGGFRRAAISSRSGPTTIPAPLPVGYRRRAKAEQCAPRSPVAPPHPLAGGALLRALGWLAKTDMIRVDGLEV